VLGLKLGILLVLTVISFPIISHVYADDIFIKFDKSEYATGDSITITGQISEFTMPVIAMSIYDPDEKILSANNVEVESDGVFTKTFFLDSSLYEKSGKYEVRLDYGSLSQREHFIISSHENPEVTKKPTTPELILLETDKPRYTDGDTITITGSVSTLESPTVLIGIYDTFGSPAGFYFGPIGSDLKFSTSFLAKEGVNFKVDGTYSVKAHYMESSKTANFDFFKSPEKPADKSPEKPADKSPEKPADKSPEKPADKSPEKPADKSPEKPADKSPEKPADKSPEKPADKSPEKPSPIVNDKNTPKKTDSDNNNSILKNTSQKTNEKIISQEPGDKIKKENNLSVEDIELGLLLNQINLTCDSSKYVDTITYYDGMGPALYRLCKFDSSLTFFDDALLKNPDDVEILTNKGSALAKLGLYSEAIIHYNHALDINPEFLPALNNKANVLVSLEQYDEAKSLYEYAIKNDPDYFTARNNLSLLNNELLQEKQNLPRQLPVGNTDDSFANDALVMMENSELLKQKNESLDLLEEITLAFSSIGSLFGFLN
jgi:tetratricopeptide (TPR) repeat protein